MTTVEIDVLDEIDEIDDAPVYPLATNEIETLARCEAVIARGVQTFIEVGEALSEIRDGKLYRAGYDTFDSYCKSRWGIGRARAYQLMDAAPIAREMSTQVDNPPQNEKEARAVKQLSPEQRADAFKRADELSGDNPRTAKHITQAAAELVAPASAPHIPDDLIAAGVKMHRHGACWTASSTFGLLRGWKAEQAEPWDVAVHAAREEIERRTAAQKPKIPEVPDLPIDYSIVQRRLATHGITLLHRTQNGVLLFVWHKRDTTPIATMDWQHILNKLSAFDTQPADPAHVERLEEQIESGDRIPEASMQIAPAGDPLPPKMIALALSDLDATLPKDLSDAGYFWHSATPPTIRHNDGWQADAPTVGQAIQAARDRERRAGDPTTVFPALSDKECRALIREAKDFIERGLSREYPTIGQALRIAARMALKLTD